MIGIVCALMCEAEKLIQRYSLKQFPQKTSFPVYHSENIFLIVSGIGKINGSAATSYLHMVSGEGPILAWLNVGVGGHAFLEIGEGRLAHQIKDGASGQVFYPIFPYKPDVKTETLITVDKVEKEYPESAVYEMESAGFFQTALHFSTAELIHCFKVISDNKKEPPIKDREKVLHLIGQNMDLISLKIENLCRLAKKLSDPHNLPDLLPFLEKWHFTVTEVHQLRRLVKRWSVIWPNYPIWDERIGKFPKAKEVLTYLNQKIEACFPFFT